VRFTFVHAADLHIDSPLAGLGTKDAAVRGRFARAGRQAVENLIDETIASGAAFLLVCGDIFDGDWKDVSTGLFFARELGRLTRAGVDTFIVNGNHDFDSAIAKTLPFPDSVRVYPSRKADTHRIERLRVALHGRSFGARLVGSEFLASYPAPHEGWFNIGLLHTALDGLRGHESYAPCTVEELKRFGYDYWALGHIHAAEIVARDPWVVFPGNIQGRSVRETGPKGAMRVTVEDGRIVAVEPIALDAARWGHVEIDVVDAADEGEILTRIEAGVGAEHALAEGRPLALRVTLRGATPLHARLVARREAIEEDARAVGFRFADDLWIEALKLDTRAPPLAHSTLADADALDVAALIAAAAEDAEFAQTLTGLIADIDAKLPRELRGEISAEPADLTRLAEDARDLLGGALRERAP
jgi:exonuclease SbcD